MRTSWCVSLIAACSCMALACSDSSNKADSSRGSATAGASATAGTEGTATGGTHDSRGSAGAAGSGAQSDVSSGAAGMGDAGNDGSGGGGRGSGGAETGGGAASGGVGGKTGSGGRPSGGTSSGGTEAGGETATGGLGTGGRTSSGGRPSGGTSSGGRGSGGTEPSGGTSSGGRGSGGTEPSGGSGTAGAEPSGGSGMAGSGPQILWSDSIQTGVSPWGLDGFGVEHPIGTEVTPSDANGANFSVVADPLGGDGFAIRHFATFDTGGSRSQGGLYGDVNTVFGDQAQAPEGIWVAQEWYFPEAISAAGDAYCWINLWDWHSIDTDRGNRWHTSPGLMLARDGSMRVVWEWGGPANEINPTSETSSIPLPVGRWFDIEMHYVWSDTPTATLSLWIDGQLAIEQSGVQTRAASHQIVETYLKFYGSTQGRGPWVPTPSLKYTRNVRVAAERIWR
jgi:hypothetical protein